MRLALLLALAVVVLPSEAFAQAKKKDPPPKKGKPLEATDPATLIVKKDFKVELLYSVPKDVEGSWVSMCVDPKGRLIVCDQYGGLFRITPPPLGTSTGSKIEKLPVDIGEAQGLLWAFDALYVMVNSGGKYKSGLYRVKSKDGDTFGPVETLRLLNGGGEHGPHAIILAPDGKSLYVVCGNNTKLTELHSSRVPKIWGEDHLLPRMPDGRGFMKGVMGPGGAIYHIDPDGKNWELISVGYRNPYDIAFNKLGDLFTYDADMEWDFNTPWYRPTRVCLATSGSEFGWRNGSGKRPTYYCDNLPGIHDVGPGSPTGITFGYGTKFPAKYQDALYICDWSYGKLYAIHMTPAGSAYKCESEEFVTGTPLPLTDLTVNPKDGALYFAIGGRRTQSGLYRVSYVGKESTEPSKADERGAEARAVRKKLESFHGKADPAAFDAAWPYLAHDDRFIRYAARVVLEHQPVQALADRAFAETDPAKAIPALLALIHVSTPCPFHRPADYKVDLALREKILTALSRIDYAKINTSLQIDLLRTYQICLNRMGKPDAEQTKKILAQLDKHFPTGVRESNILLCEILIFLEAPKVVARTLALLDTAPTQEEQMDYAKSLRVLKSGWTPEERKRYFGWFVKASSYRGGMSFQGFVNNIKSDAVALLSNEEKVELKPILEAQPAKQQVVVGQPRPFVKNWTFDELAPELEKGLTKRNFDRGRTLFGATQCFACHRYDNEGGAQGPDLTSVAGRFNARDLLESIINPNKEISDQYAAVRVELDDGKVITGRIINLAGDNMTLLPNMLDPSSTVAVDRKRVIKTEKSKVSLMPEGMLNTLQKDEILDLMAYLLSRGDRRNKMFTP